MKIESLIERLKGAGAKVVNHNGKWTMRLPNGFPQALKAELLAHKTEVKGYLDKLTTLSQGADTIGASAPGEGAGALSFAQQRLWFLDKMQGQSAEYNIHAVFEVSGQLDLPRATQAVQTIIERHQILRTVYREQNHEPLQVVLNDVAFAIDCHQVDAALDVNRSEVKAWIEGQVSRPFDLQNDLMIRVACLHGDGADGQALLVVNMHHIASDAWSLELFTQEFALAYQALSSQGAPQLPELAIQYSDYGRWQQTQVSKGVLENQFQYWQNQLADLPVLHGLVCETRPKVKQHQGQRFTAQVGPESVNVLRDIAKQHGLSPFMLLHGMLALVFSRHSNSRDIVVGTAVANRTNEQVKALLGCFVNTLVLRLNTGSDSLGEYFEHILQVHRQAQINQDVPFEQLVDRLNVPRDPASTPLFQIMLSTNSEFGLNQDQNAAGDDSQHLSLGDVSLQPLQGPVNTVKFDLDVGMFFSAQGLTLHWTFDTALFSQSNIETISGHFIRLLEALCDQHRATDLGSLPLTALQMLPRAEQQKLLFTLNDNTTAYDQHCLLQQLFEAQAAANPDKIAVQMAGEHIDYGRLNRRANQLACLLIEQGQVKPDTLVGVCAERSIEMVVGILAVLKAGGAYVALDPQYPRSRIDYMLGDSQMQVVLATQSSLDVLQHFDGAKVLLDGITQDSGHPCHQYEDGNIDPAALRLNADHLAYAIYTSGSTGKPQRGDD